MRIPSTDRSLLFLGVGLLLVAPAACTEAADDYDETAAESAALTSTVEVTGGTMEGRIAEDDLRVWEGISYAAPPVGDLRWRPPQPVVPTLVGSNADEGTTLVGFFQPVFTADEPTAMELGREMGARPAPRSEQIELIRKELRERRAGSSVGASG